MSILELENEIRACNKCESRFCSRYIDPETESVKLEVRPIIGGNVRAPIMLVGQAPGIEEYRTNEPFQGDAGARIKELFYTQGLPRGKFDDLVYQTSAIKCFPGRKKSQRNSKGEDRKPSVSEINACNNFLKRQIKEVDPSIVVFMGNSAIDSYRRMLGATNSKFLLKDYVGRIEKLGKKYIVFMAHTSGSSTWLNDFNNFGLQENAKKNLSVLFYDLFGS